MNTWAVILAAGQSSRMIQSGLSEKKQFIEFQGVPLYWKSVQTFSLIPDISGIIIAFPGEDYAGCTEQLHQLKNQFMPGIPVKSVPGGKLRQDSVFNSLHLLPEQCELVFIHDAARPFFSAGLITELLQAFRPGAGGVIPGIPCRDTIKEIKSHKVVRTLNRDHLFLIQTPQLFNRKILISSHQLAQKSALTVTDDASMVEQAGYEVICIRGSESNQKITTVEDLKMLEHDSLDQTPCTGLGYDVHRYGGPRPLIIGGIPIEGGPGVYAHSDGDVLLHALVDAILGCLGRGDIGDMFPDSDPELEDTSSAVFLAETLHLAMQDNFSLSHIDATIITQIPKISPHKERIKSNLAGLTGLDPRHISIKATTEEKLGFTGSGQGIKAVALVTGTIASKTR
ncbi:MAG: 2-C-methyl-D-erythritol 4-phosphate cytidylyltransferase [Desulfonatronovibrionaceae bacterium]